MWEWLGIIILPCIIVGIMGAWETTNEKFDLANSTVFESFSCFCFYFIAFTFVSIIIFAFFKYVLYIITFGAVLAMAKDSYNGYMAKK